ncbi:LysM peptidoglycan-binding domain-containing protein [Anaeromicropila populeti]|uniref:Glycosyl hydrolases family 18 n=1 Tax=Anaeromicropila populeti TaxID=37658 RepID=A0A1I6KLF8_9FIRM|nr:LysM peptidoglycan-binding domain-containing protein [Anaeromicropila populeti]SFR92083.1 Glycosyl hydrolases family 18 [Anaeromicropila populeti]
MVIYVVKPGDTITSIAQAYNVTAEQLITDNELTDPTNLVVGQTIVILNTAEGIPADSFGEMSINGYAYPFIDREVLTKTLPYLTYLTLFTYGFTEQGELIPIEDQEIINLARQNGVAPIMLISTLTEEGIFNNQLANTLLNNEQIQDTLINNILANMKAKNYYGLDIDFEYILPGDREAFAAFVTKVRERLNAEGYIVITALAPKTSGAQPGLLYESHDYPAIGEATNYALLMTYEWGYT